MNGLLEQVCFKKREEKYITLSVLTLIGFFFYVKIYLIFSVIYKLSK